MATNQQIMGLESVDLTNANATFLPLNTGKWFEGRYRFQRTGNPGPIAGRSLMTFSCDVPYNVAPSPNWNLVLHHVQASGDASNNPNAGARVLLRVEAQILASGDTYSAPVVIVPNQLIGCDASGDQNITVLSSSNFDSLLPLVAGDRLLVRVSRMPHTASGDSVTGHWDLNYPPILRCDVV